MAVNHAIKVFARLKKEHDSRKADSYVINRNPDNSNFEDLIFRNARQRNHGYKSFRFHKVFGEDSSQDEIFDIVAKPLINSALEGYNCTIFAYGQTGSGKTYTITGPPKRYSDRGIIPRSIQYIFKRNEKISPKAVIHISYMEIYNEIGYDLLHPRQINSVSSLEELPRIIIMEDRKGEAHIQNLSVVPVVTEEEAMKLLFLGDTNRTIAETSMNEFSSRSHCIFTIHIAQGSGATDCLRYSKLHIIDLAGSERVSKSLTTGTALTEAKHINLSLHYLQQVIVALSERRRSHIPYRNSIITYLLKDSLNGNCLSTMIANLAVSKKNIEETLSTCEYAHRVSLLKTEAVINEISDPQQEIMYLKERIVQLEEQLSHATVIQETASLSPIDKVICSSQVEEFLKDGNVKVEKDMLKIRYCFDILREKALSKSKGHDHRILEKDKINSDVTKLQQVVARKNEEIASLKRIIDNIPEQPVNPNRPREGKNYDQFHHKPHEYVTNNIVDPLTIHNLNHSDSDRNCHLNNGHKNLKDVDTNFFRQYISCPEQSVDIDYYKQALESKLQIAKVCSDAINQCQSNILYIRAKLEECCSNEKSYLIKELEEQQNIYKNMLQNLREIKNETNYLRANLEKTEARVMQKYCMFSNQISRESDCLKSSHYADSLEVTGKYDSKLHLCDQGFTCHENLTNANQVVTCHENLTKSNHSINLHGDFTKYNHGFTCQEHLIKSNHGFTCQDNLTKSKQGLNCYGSLTKSNEGLTCHDNLTKSSQRFTCHENLIKSNQGFTCRENFTNFNQGFTCHENLKKSNQSFTCHENLTKYYLQAPELCECTKLKQIEHTNSADKCVCPERSGLMPNVNNCHVEADTYCKPNIENYFCGRNPSCGMLDVENNKHPICREECYCPHTNYEQSEILNAKNNIHVHGEATTCEENAFKYDYVDATENCGKDSICTCVEAESSPLAASEENVLVTPEKESQSDAVIESTEHDKYFEEDDSQAFREFMKTVVLTGEPEVDRCVFSFYRSKLM